MIPPGIRAWISYRYRWGRAVVLRYFRDRWARPEPIIEDRIALALERVLGPIGVQEIERCERCPATADVYLATRELALCWSCLERDPDEDQVVRPGEKSLKPGTGRP